MPAVCCTLVAEGRWQVAGSETACGCVNPTPLTTELPAPVRALSSGWDPSTVSCCFLRYACALPGGGWVSRWSRESKVTSGRHAEPPPPPPEGRVSHLGTDGLHIASHLTVMAFNPRGIAGGCRIW